MKNLSYFLYGCAALAFIAILPIDSFAFYMFVRVMLFAGFLLTLFLVLDYLPEMASFLITIIGAFLWNPFFINEHTKSFWVLMDLIACGLFIYWATAIQSSIRHDEEIMRERARHK